MFLNELQRIFVNLLSKQKPALKFPKKTQKKLVLAALGSLVSAFAINYPKTGSLNFIAIIIFLLAFYILYLILFGYRNH